MTRPFLVLGSCLCLLAACHRPPATPAGPTPPTPTATPQALAAHSAEFAPGVLKVTDGVYVAVGYALANAILLEGPDGVVIVDTTETLEAGRKVLAAFRAVTPKPVRAIVYTHSHPDHVGGAMAFAEPGGGAAPGAGASAPVPVYAHEDVARNMDRTAGVLRPVITRRSLRMYGSALPPGERVNLGIGGFLDYRPGSTVGTLRPTVTFRDQLDVTVAGVEIQLVHAPGETTDHLFVWLPKSRVLLCGDNFYKAFPNLYTIRGTSYRDPRAWADSLDAMRGLHPAFLVPSHTRPLAGAENIERVLTDYRDAIRYVNDQTIRMMNQGLGPEEIAHRLKLPAHLGASPYLQEFYGKPAWGAKTVFAGTLGWYSGDATELQPLDPDDEARRMVELAGGRAALDKRIDEAVRAREWQWVLRLTGFALRAAPGDAAGNDAARRARIVALRALGAAEANPPARDWYFTAARELDGLQLPLKEVQPTPAMLAGIPVTTFFDGMAVNLRAEECLDRVIRVGFTFTDTGERYTYVVRRGVSEVLPGVGGDDAIDLGVEMPAQAFKEMLAGVRKPVAVLASEVTMTKGNRLELARFLKLFQPPEAGAE